MFYLGQQYKTLQAINKHFKKFTFYHN